MPALYMILASAILAVLAIYRGATTWLGFAIVLLGIPLFILARRARARELDQKARAGYLSFLERRRGVDPQKPTSGGAATTLLTCWSHGAGHDGDDRPARDSHGELARQRALVAARAAE